MEIGSYGLEFSDLFHAAVLDNPNLSGTKVTILEGCLKSDTYKIISSLSITNSNFQITSDLLTERYFNKREIISSLTEKFVNISNLNSESQSQS